MDLINWSYLPLILIFLAIGWIWYFLNDTAGALRLIGTLAGGIFVVLRAVFTGLYNVIAGITRLFSRK
jgi:hypothetical protein